MILWLVKKCLRIMSLLILEMGISWHSQDHMTLCQSLNLNFQNKQFVWTRTYIQNLWIDVYIPWSTHMITLNVRWLIWKEEWNSILDSNSLITWMRRSYLSRTELISISKDFLILRNTTTMTTSGIFTPILTISLKLSVNQRECQEKRF